MADKFRVTYPIDVTFGTGEQPSSVKINAINSQAKNGLLLVERGLGDVWNQSGDSLLIDNPLQITNLARAIGEQKYLNARFIKPNMSGSDTIHIQEAVSGVVGQTQIPLAFKGDASAVLNASVAALTGAGGAYDASPVGNLSDVTTDTEWYYSATRGIVYLGSALVSGSNIEYEVQNDNLPSDGPDAFATNVIPPPAQLDWNGIKIVQIVAGKYLLVLPPRRPTSELSSGLGKTPSIGVSHPWINTITVDSSDDFYWYFAPGASAGNWDDTSPAKNATIKDDAARFTFVQDPRYRYQLPEVLHDEIVNGAAGTILPSGSLFLWDSTNKTTIEGVTFKTPETDDLYNATWTTRPGWVIQAEGADLDTIFAAYLSTDATDDPADYKSRFSIIATGNSAASAVDNVRFNQLTNSNSLAVATKHYELALLQAADGDRAYTSLPAPYRVGDEHPQYLSREGSTSTGSETRDRFNNAMLGDLFMASTSSANNYDNTGAPSNKILFGSVAADTGATVYLNDANTGTFAQVGSSWNPTRMLSLEDAPVHIASGILNFGVGTVHNSNFNGILTDTGKFKFFQNNLAGSSSLSAGEFISIGSTHSPSTARGTTDAFKGLDDAKYLRVNSPWPSGSSIIEYKGSNLDISGASGTTNDVVVGESNASTYLELRNNRLYFGTSANSDYISFDGTDSFEFRENGSMLGSYVKVGRLRLQGTSNQIAFQAEGDDDKISFSGITFTFTANTSVYNSEVSAGYLETKSNEIRFDGTNNKFQFISGEGLYKFLATGLATEVEVKSLVFPSPKTQKVNVPVSPSYMFVTGSNWSAAYMEFDSGTLNFLNTNTGGPTITLNRSVTDTGANATVCFPIPKVFALSHPTDGQPQVNAYQVGLLGVSGGNTITVKARIRHTEWANTSSNPFAAGTTTAQTLGSFTCSGNSWHQLYIGSVGENFYQSGADAYHLEIQFSSSGMNTNVFRLVQLGVEFDWHGI